MSSLVTALHALWGGSVGSWYALTSSTLVRAVPLMLTGTAVAIAFRAGVFNIGAEGQLLVGAASAAAAALAMPGAGVDIAPRRIGCEIEQVTAQGSSKGGYVVGH